ncbi:MAG: hypothetical protein RL885_18340 [Planctomycetota bacterium]
MTLHRRASRLFASCLALLLVSAVPAMAQRINEVRLDQPGSDNDEYIELSGTAGASLDGLFIVVVGDGPGAVGNGAIEEIVDLSGQTVKANGTFLVAQPGYDDDGNGNSVYGWRTKGQTPDLTVDLNLENSDNLTILLVRDLLETVGLNTDLDPDDDCDIDVVAWTQVVDLVRVYDEAQPGGGDCTYLYPPFAGRATNDPETAVGPFVDGLGNENQPYHILKTVGGDWQVGKEDPVIVEPYEGVVDTPRLQNGTVDFNGLAFPGNTVNFTVWAPGEAGSNALVLLSCTPGALPGIPLPGDGRRIPLTPDACFSLGLTLSALLTAPIGAEGLGETFEVPFPNYNAQFSGVSIFHAVVTTNGANFGQIIGPSAFTLL